MNINFFFLCVLNMYLFRDLFNKKKLKNKTFFPTNTYEICTLTKRKLGRN